ncbi:hypothetical protein Tco_0728771 [Tanacetum coccineum]|uniref:Retrovirus-related Pol polyprotein from transposon TNT 1-94-like beta-barrel domain-containing protein n=1 Tax=Tanacetum coccineum TaxID=301880 RepID=A0ABQ4YMY5_9ASTR
MRHSLSHLIRDCDFYENKMAREAELKKQRVFNTGNGVAKPVWNNANRVNHANHFVPRPLQLNAIRPNSNSVRPNVNTSRENVNSVRQNVNSVRSNVNTVRPKQPVPTSNSNSFSPVRPQGNWGTAVKTSTGYNWRNTRPNSNCNSGSNFVRTDHPLKNMEDRGIFDSGCSAHMTGNKNHLDDFEECKGESVTFGGELIFFLGLQVKQKTNGLFISQDKYVAEMLKKFDLTSVKTAITPMETKMALTKDEEADDVDIHLYRSMIDNDYARANLNRKSITDGCQFLGRRLISWQCKKQTHHWLPLQQKLIWAAKVACGQSVVEFKIKAGTRVSISEFQKPTLIMKAQSAL